MVTRRTFNRTMLAAGTSLAFVASGETQSPYKGYKPPAGFVPDSVTALKIAQAVLTPIYGEEQLATEKPFTAVLHNDVWLVEGHLPYGFDGGVAEISISKIDGRILHLEHGK